MSKQVQAQNEDETSPHPSSARCPHLGAQYNPFEGPHVNNPHPLFERLRKEEPVSFNPMLGMWLVSRYDDIVRVLHDTTRFSSRDMTRSGTQLTDEAQDILAQGFPMGRVLVSMDPPEHTRLRRLMNRGFTAQRIAGMAPFIEKMARELIGRFAKDGHADLVEQLAYPLPAHVILGVIGVPQEDIWKIKKWSADRMRLLFEQVPPENQVELAHGVIEMQRYCAELIEARRKAPREDLTSYLVEVESDGEALTQHELVMAISASFLSAGHQSTTALMANTWKLALEHGLWKRLRDDRELVPRFIEEGCRYDSAHLAMIRTALEDVEVGGILLPQGSRLLLLYAAGSRDESLCPHADTLDVDREKPPQHLNFGRGPHFCLGAALARLQTQLTTHLLLDVLEDPRLVPGQDHGIWQSLVLRQMKHLRVEWTPASRAT